MGRPLASIVASLILAFAPSPSARAQGPTDLGGQAQSRERARARPVVATASLRRYEPTGLSLSRPYTRGKIPVVFVHGLWSSPRSWDRLITELEADPALADRYQYWTFGYSTGDPIPYSAALLRGALQEMRWELDPGGTDAAFDQIVLVGHSMGGLLAKMLVLDSGTRLWRLISDHPIDELAGEPGDRDLFRRALIFEPQPEVRRVIFIATPHRGSHVDRGSLHHLGTRLVRLPDALRAAHGRLLARNGSEFFREHIRGGLPTSIDELEWGSPILTALHDLRLSPAVQVHSIIADRGNPPRPGGTDGLVPYASAHLDGAASERIISSGHLCQDHPDVIREVRRILLEHASAADTPQR
jgi:pimeloyl-ACP methyl ester carboxylesterase